MTRIYYGTKRVLAWPQAHDDGREGYGVKYSDDYISWSPKDVFEAAYMSDAAMGFGHALAALEDGFTVARKGWNGKGLWIEMQLPDENSKMTLPYLYLNYPEDDPRNPGAKVPWLASQTDVIAKDWHVVSQAEVEKT